MNSLTCPGCGRGFTARGLLAHQNTKFVTLSCKPEQPTYFVHDRGAGVAKSLHNFSAVNPRYSVMKQLSNGECEVIDVFVSAKAARDTAKDYNAGVYA